MIGRLEEALSRVIDGGVSAVFRLSLQPAEIGRQLERALLDSRRVAMGHAIGANRYTVRLHPDDFAQFADWEAAMARELEDGLAEIAFRQSIAPVGAIRVTVFADPAVRRRTVKVTSAYDDMAPGPAPVRAQPAMKLREVGTGTRVVPLQGDTIRVGRAAGNDVVIDAAEVSREHAELRRHGGTWKVHDLGSRNGTWVNGRKVTEAVLQPGDEIRFGQTGFRFERS
ncbi:MAG: DUF3662 and FHA domain-containing protein [Thermomicrobiales bacterium]